MSKRPEILSTAQATVTGSRLGWSLRTSGGCVVARQIHPLQNATASRRS
jgi:hypothetical protein